MSAPILGDPVAAFRRMEYVNAGIRAAGLDYLAGTLSTDPLGDARTVEPFDILEQLAPDLAMAMGADMSDATDAAIEAVLAAWLEGYAIVRENPGAVAFIDSYLCGVAVAVSPERWNGWACPYFTRSEGERIAAQTVIMAAQPGYGDDVEVISWDQSRAAFIGTSSNDGQDGPQVYGPVTLPGIHEPVYAIGSWGWTWEIAQ